MPQLDVAHSSARTAIIDGKEVLVFGGCGYLGLNHEPRIHEAITAGLRRFGSSSSASRETTGNTRAHTDLESALTDFFGTESAVLVPDGYLANVAALQALARTHDAIILDDRSHASLHDAARTAGLDCHTFRHADATDAKRVAESVGRRIVVATDGVFAAAGTVAPVTSLAAILPRGSTLLVDDCHGVGVLAGGRGSVEHAGLRSDARIVITTSLAKGIGVAGGAVAASDEVCAAVQQSNAYVCTTPIGPALAMGTREALRIIADEPRRIDRLALASRLLVETVSSAAGTRVGHAGTPILAWVPGGSTATIERICAAALDVGVLLPHVRYPGGPAESYLRLAVTCEHTEDDFARLAAALSKGIA